MEWYPHPNLKHKLYVITRNESPTPEQHNVVNVRYPLVGTESMILIDCVFSISLEKIVFFTETFLIYQCNVIYTVPSYLTVLNYHVIFWSIFASTLLSIHFPFLTLSLRFCSSSMILFCFTIYIVLFYDEADPIKPILWYLHLLPSFKAVKMI